MKFEKITITSQTKENAETEILYEVKKAKIRGMDLLILNKDTSVVSEKDVKTILSTLKKQGNIQLFSTWGDKENTSVENTYLQNKFPDVFRDVSMQAFIYILI